MNITIHHTHHYDDPFCKRVIELLESIMVDTTKLAADVATLIAKFNDLSGQVAALKAAQASNDQTAVQAAIDAIDATVQGALNPPPTGASQGSTGAVAGTTTQAGT